MVQSPVKIFFPEHVVSVVQIESDKIISGQTLKREKKNQILEHSFSGQ